MSKFHSSFQITLFHLSFLIILFNATPSQLSLSRWGLIRPPLPPRIRSHQISIGNKRVIEASGMEWIHRRVPQDWSQISLEWSGLFTRIHLIPFDWQRPQLELG